LRGLPRRAAAVSATSNEHDDLRELSVIPVTNFRNTAGQFEHRVPPLTATTKAEAYLAGHDDVHLPEHVIQRLVQGAVEPIQIDGIRIERHRVESGWLMVMSYRAYSPMIGLAIENDRLLAEAEYAADPQASSGAKALALPEPHAEYAMLLHTDDPKDVLETVDRSFQTVKASNPQDVGERLVERPLMLVPAQFTGEDGQPADELTTVDGNCRLSSCFALIEVPRGWLDDSLISDASKETVQLLPSHLMRMPLSDRRDLVRKVIKAAYRRLAKPSTGRAGDIRERNQAVMTLNAITVPVQAIVGYADDDPERGMERFPAAVRALLMRMNVGVRPFDKGAQNAVTAEEIITGLYTEGLLGRDAKASAMRDVLIGRGNVGPAMQDLGLDPQLPDLRFALVVQQLTRKSTQFNAVMRSKLPTLSKTGRLVVGRRNGPIVELGLRSYSAGAKAKVRTALETICLWQDLVDNTWDVENVDTDERVDELLARAEAGETEAILLLGVLGMIALVMSGHLLAAAGSAEEVAGTTIARTSVGQIIKELLDKPQGPMVLADAVKRVRAGLPPRWWDAEKEELTEQPSSWRGSTYNAHLRGAVKHGFKPKSRGKTDAEREADALTTFQETLGESENKLLDLKELRHKNGTTARIPWVEVEPSFTKLEGLTKSLRRISEEEPEQW
jgi:hypothetical protein